MLNKLVSIVVPIYQVKDYLELCIESILRQTYKNIEIILVDDGSTDGSGQICDEYQLKDRRIVVIHKKNDGVVSARKAGTSIAQGEYLCFVDGDDWIEYDYISNFMVYAYEEPEMDIIWSLVFQKEYKTGSMLCGMVNYDKKLLDDKSYQKKLYQYIMGEFGFQYEITYSVCTECFKKSFIEMIQNKMDDSVEHDEDFFCMIQCILDTKKIKFIHNDGYHYIQREDSGVRKAFSAQDNRNVTNKMIEMVEKKYNNKAIKLLILKKYYVEQLYHGNISCLQNDDFDVIVPYRNATKGKEIILYGMGNVGKYLLQYFNSTKVCNVIGYIDKLKNSDDINLKQYEIEYINYIKYDYILITTVKKNYVDEIRQLLRQYNVKDSQIAFVDDVLLDKFIDYETENGCYN